MTSISSSNLPAAGGAPSDPSARPMPKAAIFDLDGTLLDSMGVWDRIDMDFLARRGFDVPDDYVPTISAMPFEQVAAYTIDRFRLDETPEAVMAEWDDMAHEAYATMVEAKPGAVEYLTYLREAGVQLGVATSLTPSLREPAMRHVGIFDFFATITSVDDVHGIGKDRPDVYLLAASRLGAEPNECAVFEDILPGIRSAKTAGMRVWAMHDDSSDADWTQICALADGVMFDFYDAPRFHGAHAHDMTA